MSKAKEPKRIITVYEAADEAIAILKRAGFEFVNVSMRSEAVYYRFPGRHGVIRVATHSGGKAVPGLDRTLAKLTFLPHKLRKEPDTLVITENSLHSLVCAAIGRYMVHSNEPKRQTYHGPNPANAKTFHMTGATP